MFKILPGSARHLDILHPRQAFFMLLECNSSVSTLSKHKGPGWLSCSVLSLRLLRHRAEAFCRFCITNWQGDMATSWKSEKANKWFVQMSTLQPSRRSFDCLLSGSEEHICFLTLIHKATSVSVHSLYTHKNTNTHCLHPHQLCSFSWSQPGMRWEIGIVQLLWRWWWNVHYFIALPSCHV